MTTASQPGVSKNTESVSSSLRDSINKKSVVAAVLSIAIGIGILVLFSVFGAVRWTQVKELMGSVDRGWFFLLCCLFAFNSFLSGEKWRLTHRALSEPQDEMLPRTTAFSLTTLGVALGQFLPVQVSASFARTLGTWAEGHAVRKGTLGTLVEQAFDFLVLCVLVLATLAARLISANVTGWALCTLAALVFAIWFSPLLGQTIKRIASFSFFARVRTNRWFELLIPALSTPALGRRLMLISALRFVVLALMAKVVALAIHSPIPLWQLAAAIPFGLLSALLGITPAGLGISEFAFVGVLSGFGTPRGIGAEWAIANRLLTFAAAFFAAALGAVILGIHHARSKNQSLRRSAAAS